MYLAPKTQKAQGIMALGNIVNGIFGLDGPGHPLMVIPGALKDCGIAEIKFPVFARPCPFEPRHGFVNSRLVYNWQEVIILVQKAAMAGNGDPTEIILTPPLSGVVSAVATNAGVTWGYGNDGITAGSETCPLLIPVKTNARFWRKALEPLLDFERFFEAPDCPYLELVENNGKICVVQARGGPEQPEGFNYVVRKIKVRHVLLACKTTNLLKWEKTVLSHKGVTGTVIYAPFMSLSAHCCVHGIENGIPVVTDHSPKVGDTIEATKNKIPALTVRDYRKLAALIVENLDAPTHLNDQIPQNQAFLTAIATIQAQFCWGKQNHLLHLRSQAVVLLMKGVLAGCCGELRHWRHERSFGRNGPPPTIIEHLPIVLDKESISPRADIYADILNRKRALSLLRIMLTKAKVDLLDTQWGKSYGGRPWANVARTGLVLNNALKLFLATPCSKTWSCVIQRANRLINTSHNTGKCLTKWVSPDTMNAISLSPTVGFLNPHTAFEALGMNRKGKDK